MARYTDIETTGGSYEYAPLLGACNARSCREAGVRRSAVQDHSSGVAGAILAAARLEVWIGLTAIARQRPKQPVARKKGYDGTKGVAKTGWQPSC